MKFLRELTTLLEYAHEVTVQNFGQKLMDRAKKDPTAKQFAKDPSQILQQIERADPDKIHYSNTQWLVRFYLNQAIKLEDLISTVGDSLDKYFKLKTRKMLQGEHRDINKIKTYHELSQIVKSYPDPDTIKSEKQIKEDKGSYEVIFTGKDVSLVKIKDRTAAIYFGRGTDWCTASSNLDRNYYDQYAKNDDLYVVIPTQPEHPHEKYQLHLQSRSCKDEHDGSFKFSKLLERFPELVQAFKKIPGYNELPHLNTDPAEREKARQLRIKQEQQREADIDDFLKSLMK